MVVVVVVVVVKQRYRAQWFTCFGVVFVVVFFLLPLKAYYYSTFNESVLAVIAGTSHEAGI